jgi:hypothetical protein
MPARQREPQPYANETSSSSIAFLFICWESCTPQPDQREHLVRGLLLPIYSAVEITPSILLPIAGIALGARPSAAELSVLGRPGILLFLGVDLLGFLLPFQLLVNEVELLIFLRPELLS